MTKFRKKCASLADRRPGPGRRSSDRRAASSTESLSEKRGPERPAPAVRTGYVREREHETPARPDQEPAGFSYGPAPGAAWPREAVSRRTKRTVWDEAWSPRLSARNRKFIRRSNRRKKRRPRFSCRNPQPEKRGHSLSRAMPLSANGTRPGSYWC